METKNKKFRGQLEDLINANSKENGSNTPDWILAEYLDHCLSAFDLATQKRDLWYGEIQSPDNIVEIREG